MALCLLTYTMEVLLDLLLLVSAFNYKHEGTSPTRARKYMQLVKLQPEMLAAVVAGKRTCSTQHLLL